MSSSFERHLPVSGTYNIRDLGGYPSAVGETRWRRLLRADGLHRLDAEGRAALEAEGVSTIIDLRHQGERESEPNPFESHATVRYHTVSLFDRLAPTADPGIDALLDLYLRALAERQAEIRTILSLIAAAPDGAVLFHCAAGKDRTGLIAALLLANAQVDPAAILADYALTGVMIAPLLDDIIARHVARGGRRETLLPLLACDPATLAATLDHLDRTYGSPRDYLAHIGLDDATLARLEARLTGDL